jgi:hypothetical protein
MREETLRSLLEQGKHSLSRGRVLDVASRVRAQPNQAGKLIEFLWDPDPGVAKRAADVLERISFRCSPALQRILDRSRLPLLSLLEEATLNKTRWNLALAVPRLSLTPPEVRRAAKALFSYLDDPGSIVKTAALQGLFDLAQRDPSLLPTVHDLLRIHERNGTPAMRARSRRLLQKIEKNTSRKSPTSRHE